MKDRDMSQHARQISDVRAEANLSRLYRSLPKLKVFNPAEFPEGVHERIKHVLGRREGWSAFVGRTGLGPGQILVMSSSEITAFVAQAEARSLEEYTSAAEMQPKRFPRKFFIDPASEESVPQVGF